MEKNELKELSKKISLDDLGGIVECILEREMSVAFDRASDIIAKEQERLTATEILYVVGDWCLDTRGLCKIKDFDCFKALCNKYGVEVK